MEARSPKSRRWQSQLNALGEHLFHASLSASGVAGPLGCRHITSVSASIFTRPLPSPPSHHLLCSYNDTSHIGLGPVLMTSFWLDYVCKSYFQIRPHSQVPGLGRLHVFLEGHNSIHGSELGCRNPFVLLTSWSDAGFREIRWQNLHLSQRCFIIYSHF